jgi:threonylcarbamoyladenosine tRNA methylthiotransferase MtaB
MDNKIVFRTLGCKLNQAETEALAREADQLRARYGDNLAVVNTCAVTSKAEQKARAVVRQFLKEGRVVLVTGCYAALRAKELAELGAGVKVVEKRELFGGDHFGLWSPRQAFHSRAFLKIQDGCRNACAFCETRLARGPSVSLNADEAARRLRSLEEAGVREAVLTGVNITQYDDQGLSLSGLIKKLLAETRSVAIRLSSLDPDAVDSAFAEAVTAPRVRPHFHLSVQSGSDAVLRRMRRRNTAADVRNAARLLREAKDDPFLGADIITGFPGETTEDAALTFRLCEEVGFAWIHAFPFSRRPGTEAWNMRARVPERVADERVAALTALARQNRAAYTRRWLDREVDAVIVDRSAENDLQGVPALSENYLKLLVSGSALPSGRSIRCRLKSALNDVKYDAEAILLDAKGGVQ